METVAASLAEGTTVLTHCAQEPEIIDLADRGNLTVGVDMHKRYDPDHRKIFGELCGDLGDPVYARGVLEEPLEVSTQTFKEI